LQKGGTTPIGLRSKRNVGLPDLEQCYELAQARQSARLRQHRLSALTPPPISGAKKSGALTDVNAPLELLFN